MAFKVTESPADRFWRQVDRRGADECWEWIGARIEAGYGKFWIAGKTVSAHRHAWSLTHGQDPTGASVLHRCDNPPCVNPSHLFLGTQADNVADAKAKGRTASGDRNGSRVKPERMPRGDRNGARTKPDRLRRGSLVWASKLTPDDVLAIRAAAALGAKQSDLARKYGVTPQAVFHVVHRLSWRHVEPTVAASAR